MEGASTPSGVPLPWTRLQPSHGRWTGRLGRPAWRGVYPLEIRTAPDRRVLRNPSWMVRVFSLGTLARPSFATPEGVATWWVETVAAGTVAAVRRWAPLAYDRRDTRLHQLMVVSYHPTATRDASERLGSWITAVRDGYRGQWRLLEATVRP